MYYHTKRASITIRYLFMLQFLFLSTFIVTLNEIACVLGLCCITDIPLYMVSYLDLLITCLSNRFTSLTKEKHNSHTQLNFWNKFDFFRPQKNTMSYFHLSLSVTTKKLISVQAYSNAWIYHARCELSLPCCLSLFHSLSAYILLTGFSFDTMLGTSRYTITYVRS